MSPIYFTAGPSKLHPKFETFMQKAIEENIPSISHRGEVFTQMCKELSTNLKILLQVPEDYSVFYLSSATECMERVIQNCSEKNTLHFVGGTFAKKFSIISSQHGRTVTEIEPNKDYSFDLSFLPDGITPELVCITHNETTTGTTLPNEFISDLRKRFPDALFALDMVSSVPTCELDFTNIDCAFFSVQKGFGLPAGLATMFVSPRALQRAATIEKKGLQYTGSFHSFVRLAKYACNYQTSATPNVLGMYLLHRVCLDFLEKGRETLVADTKTKAEMLYSTIEEHTHLQLLITTPELRSKTIVVIGTPEGSKEAIALLKEKGFIVSTGYGEQKDTQLRIANFPSHTIEEVKQLCTVLSEEFGNR